MLSQVDITVSGFFKRSGDNEADKLNRILST
jgi:hypothetical protein